ncbi:MAG TPA: hypothetical protein VFY84_14530 [Jiangellales bacterium]|nr:hypothetical protein [Jiangellales bacterium]
MVHPPPGAGPQDRTSRPSVDGFPDGAQHRDRQRDVGRLGTLAEHVQQLVPGLLAQVGDVGRAGLGHPQAEHPEQADQGVVVGPELRAAASRAANSSGCSTVRFCPSHATLGRVTAAAGLAGMSPSMTAYL